mgnify:CR=1 FL=1
MIMRLLDYKLFFEVLIKIKFFKSLIQIFNKLILCSLILLNIIHIRFHKFIFVDSLINLYFLIILKLNRIKLLELLIISLKDIII